MTDQERVAALDQALASANGEIQFVHRELARLRKECATCCLQLLDRALFVDDNAAIADLEAGQTDPHVLALVKLGQPFPLDTCTGCGRPAPVNDDGVCAWGCPP